MSGRSLRYGGGCSRPSRRIPDVEKLDVRLQHERGLVRALCQPDDHCRKMGRDTWCAGWPRGKDTRHGGFPAYLNETGRLSHADLAALIRRDRVDVLVELTGHMGGNDGGSDT